MTTSKAQNEWDQQLHFSERVGTVPPETHTLKRALDILFRPDAVWPVIAQEEGGLKEVFLPYTVMIALVPTLMGALLSAGVFGTIFALMGSGGGLGFPGALFHGVMEYVYGMVGMVVLSKILEMMAPSFGLKSSWVLSCRLLVYSATPCFLAAAVTWIPFLGWLVSLAAFVWSLVLARSGASALLKIKPAAANPVSEPEPELVKI